MGQHPERERFYRPDTWKAFDYTPPSGNQDDVDLAFELLCSMSTSPKPIGEMALDMRVTKTHLRQLAMCLRQLGFDVATGRRPGSKTSQCVWINREGWPYAQAQAEHYWRRVWEHAPQQENAA